MRRFATFLSLCALLVAWSLPVVAQDTPVPTGPAPAADLSESALAAGLAPLTKAQLVGAAGAWQAALQAQVTLVSQAKLAAETDEAAKATVAPLEAQRDALIKHHEAVLAELQRKGGTAEEIAPFESYIGAVSGIELDVKDPLAAWTAVQDWALSTDGGIKIALNLVIFIVLLIVFKIVAAIAAGIVKRSLSISKVKTSDLLRDFFINTTRKLVFFIGLVVSLPFIGLDIGPFLAAIGAAGLIIGFALQESLSNFAAGIMILLYRPYDVGDVVSVAGVTGKVNAMSLVSTTLLTPDNQNVVVPNGSIWGGIITNITGNDTRRVDLVFGIGYDDDIGKAQSVLEEIIAAHPLVLKDPEPVVKVHELADSSVNFVARPWSKTSDYWAVYWDLTRTVKERFDKEGISIPYPQTDIHVHQVAS